MNKREKIQARQEDVIRAFGAGCLLAAIWLAEWVVGAIIADAWIWYRKESIVFWSIFTVGVLFRQWFEGKWPFAFTIKDDPVEVEVEPYSDPEFYKEPEPLISWKPEDHFAYRQEKLEQIRREQLEDTVERLQKAVIASGYELTTRSETEWWKEPDFLTEYERKRQEKRRLAQTRLIKEQSGIDLESRLIQDQVKLAQDRAKLRQDELKAAADAARAAKLLKERLS